MTIPTRASRPSSLPPWPELLSILQDDLTRRNAPLPAVAVIHRLWPNPFSVLVSTIISLRTQDAVTFGASKRVLERAQTPEQLLALDVKLIEDLLFPAGFYRRKAEQLLAISKILVTEYHSQVPNTLSHLTKLPGVGLKTANLVLGIGFNQPAICVDIHVHRIANRIGAITSKTPDESLTLLMDAIPKTHWIQTNQVLVPFGQTVCTPRRPHCSSCPIHECCPRISANNPR